MQHPKQGYLATLDGWRAIAIFAVILDHLVGYSVGNRFPKLLSITRIGPNGVSLFFAISGFLICSRLLEELQKTGRISLSGFYIRRASRILPPAIAYLAFAGLLGAAGIIALTSREWWGSIFFFRNYLPPSLISRGWGGYTIHYWSLGVEEHFYLIWPALLVLTGPKRVKWVAAGLATSIAIWRSYDLRHGVFEKKVQGILFASRTDIRLDGLLLGCLMALLLAEPYWRDLFLRAMRWWVWAACVIAYICIQLLYRRHYYTLMESALLAIIVASTVVRPDTVIGRLLELGWVRLIGRLSYSLYLWQQLFLVRGARHPWSILQRFPVNVILLMITAAFSYHFIERPMIRLGHSLAPPPTPGREDLGEVAEIPQPRITQPVDVSA